MPGTTHNNKIKYTILLNIKHVGIEFLKEKVKQIICVYKLCKNIFDAVTKV
jgi:hypothetical protein